MLIRFTKGPVTAHTDLLACERPDGTGTAAAMPKQAILPHDAFHFVVEKTLGWRDAFFAAIAAGATLADTTARFHAVKKSSGQPPRICQIETLITCLQAEQWGGGSDPAVFITKFAAACRQARTPPPPLTPDDLARVRLALREFGAAWRPLNPGQSIERPFP
jgi:hypothetical protein